MKYAVVVVTYNRLALLKECIEHISNQTNKQFDNVIIVNNASTDATKDFLENIVNEKINIIHLNENIGGAGGFYEGMKKAYELDVDWILLIDDDAILEYNFLSNMNQFIERDENRTLAYGCKVLTNNELYTGHRLIKKFKNLFLLEKVKENEYKKPYFDCDSATFCGLLLSKEIIQKCGLPIKDYFIWADDTEYCTRIEKYSKIRNINSAVLNHKTNGTFATFSWKKYYGARNQVHMVKKHYNKFNLMLCVARQKLMCLYYLLHIKETGKTKEYIKTLYRDAINDGINNRLGKNNKYFSE